LNINWVEGEGQISNKQRGMGLRGKERGDNNYHRATERRKRSIT